MYKTIIVLAFFFLGITVYSCKQPGSTRHISANQRVVGLNIGNLAPELAYPDPEGKIIKLSSLRGNMVLIDFWASWCPPCRRDNPLLVAAYHEFGHKKFTTGNGFAIYSVSCDYSHDAWIEAIKQDRLNWVHHVSDLKGWESEAAKTYRIDAIPANVLIDGDGIIVAKDISSDRLKTTLSALVIE